MANLNRGEASQGGNVNAGLGQPTGRYKPLT
jgi:hypothetical protein